MSEMKMTPELEQSLNRVRQQIKEKLKRDDARISVSMYSKEDVEREEGEEWEDEKGRLWTIKNGKKEGISKFQGAKTPWFCPKCEGIMSHRNDDMMYRKKGKCFSCVLKDETQIRLSGLWPLYENIQIKQNQIGFMKDRIQELTNYRDTLSQPTFVYESGEIERWNVDLEQVKDDLSKDIDRIAEVLKTFEEELKNDKSDYDNKWTEYIASTDRDAENINN